MSIVESLKSFIAPQAARPFNEKLATTAAERAKQLADYKSSVVLHHSEIAASLREQALRLETNAGELCREADARAEAKRRELGAQIAAEYYAAVPPRLATWIEQPNRSDADAIRDAGLHARERARALLGAPFADEHLMLAMLGALEKHAPLAAHVWFGWNDAVLNANARCWGATTPAEFSRALELLEELLTKVVRASGPNEVNRAARALAPTCATSEDLQRAREGQLASHRAAELEEHLATYTPPPGMRIL